MNIKEQRVRANERKRKKKEDKAMQEVNTRQAQGEKNYSTSESPPSTIRSKKTVKTNPLWKIECFGFQKNVTVTISQEM